MSLATANLNNLSFQVLNSDGQALSQEVTKTQLSHRSAAPSIDLSFRAQSHGVTFTAVYIYDKQVGKSSDWLDLVFIQHISTA